LVNDSDRGALLSTKRVDGSGVAEVRHVVAAAAEAIGLDRAAADRFVVAVNEVVINAIRHGGGIADVTIAGDGMRLSVTVVDFGPGLTVRVPTELPPPEQTHGRGLWLTHHLCDDVTIDSSPTGTRVRLAAAAAPVS
jgi:anti-sigma regulatory factor (Ser/Thr protein kinase)